jgi:hypothetical protein
MRKAATVKNPLSKTKRVIVHESRDGVYLFSFLSPVDGPAASDQWFQTVDEADETCSRLYAIGANDWVNIEDPSEGCQQDWIASVRVKGRNTGKPQWGIFERLEKDGTWREIR